MDRIPFNNQFFSYKSQQIEPPSISWLMRLALDRPELISLAAGFTDNSSLPVDLVRQLVDQILSDPKKGQSALQYGTTLGSTELRIETANRLQRLDHLAGVEKSPALNEEQLLITQGSQQALYLLLEAITDPGDIFLVEDPTYFVFLGLLKGFGIRTRGVATDHAGILPEELDRKLDQIEKAGELDKVKALYLVTYAQNPTGRSTDYDRKKQALDILRKYENRLGRPIALIEDAAYRELEFDPTKTAPSLLAEEEHRDRVFYLGTYTKPFATGIRVGFGHFPTQVLEKLCNLKGLHDFGVSNFTQVILAEALKSGAYEAQTQKLQARYLEKASAMEAALKKFAPSNLTWEFPRGGLYIWATLTDGQSTGPKSKLFERSLDQGVLYIPGIYAYAEDSGRQRPDSEMRLSYGAADLPALETGICRLCEAISAQEVRTEH
jgi:2-aminoadipate transaminase